MFCSEHERTFLGDELSKLYCGVEEGRPVVSVTASGCSALGTIIRCAEWGEGRAPLSFWDSLRPALGVCSCLGELLPTSWEHSPGELCDLMESCRLP